MATPTDPLYSDQWQFDLIGDIESVWDDYDGTGVSVGVYDDGVEYTHEDLDDNYDASLHFTYDGTIYDPSHIRTRDGHGTSCAGLIGAEDDNGVGGTGVAPGVSLTGVNYLGDIQYESQEVNDAAMLWAANFDIMSNSWGWGSSFSRDQNLTNTTGLAYHEVQLWGEVVETGRDGLGTVIVKAAGNETNNANGDGWNASRYSITVAATDENGDATYYTNYGACILVAAPAASVTTDRSGDEGYNGLGDGDPIDPDYTSEFGGTSAATPVVAGVVALMLEANPLLGWRDVQNILALSASHTGSDFGAPAGAEEVGTWQTMEGTSWNGGGTMFHQSYGYGMVDAYAAVRMAEGWFYFYDEAATSANEVTASGSYTGATVNIPDNGTDVSLGITVTEDITIEYIEVYIDITHMNARNLNIWLEAPDGTRVQIFNAGDASTKSMDDGMTWIFGVDALRGYSSEGTWEVVFEDTVTGETGYVEDASLTFYGSEATTDTVFHFTDDFAALVAYEPERGTITDVDGGTDWVDFAPMTGNVSLNMSNGGAVAVDGTTLAYLGTGSTQWLENAYMGDGNDTVTGNSRGNEIITMRGNDSIHGKAGNDSIEGGEGADKLYGDNGADTLLGGYGNDQIYGNGGNDWISGGLGADTFVFAGTFALTGGQDTISDFKDNVDTIKLDDSLWGGAAMTVAQVIATYATVSGGNTVFNFGSGKVFVVNGVTDTSVFLDDIVIF